LNLYLIKNVKPPKITVIGNDSFIRDMNPSKENSIEESLKNKYSNPSMIEILIQTSNITNGSSFLSVRFFLEK